jgi:hypothetical protein
MAVLWDVPITLMLEATSSSETLVSFYQTAQCNIPEVTHLFEIKSTSLSFIQICVRKLF